MSFLPTSIPDVVLISPRIIEDKRGFFTETYQANRYQEAGIPNSFVQDNHSGSTQGSLRGLHYQIHQPQGKLLRVVVGEIFDVAVDLRLSSATYGKWVGVHLSAENKHQLWIPPGFAHGFYVLSNWAELLYKATDYYAPKWERTLLWNDSTIGIEWPLQEDFPPILSERDALGTLLVNAECFE